MKKTSLWAAAALSAGLAMMPLLGQAEGGDHCTFHGYHGMGAMGGMGGRGGFSGYHASPGLMMVEQLAAMPDMTDEQRTQLRAIADKHRPQSRTLFDQMRTARRDLFTQARAEHPDRAKVMAATEAKAKVEGEMIMLRSQVRGEIASVLTDKQRQRWMTAHRPGRFGHGQGEHGHGGHGDAAKTGTPDAKAGTAPAAAGTPAQGTQHP